jgi:hypothetical protein
MYVAYVRYRVLTAAIMKRPTPEKFRLYVTYVCINYVDSRHSLRSLFINLMDQSPISGGGGDKDLIAVNDGL